MKTIKFFAISSLLILLAIVSCEKDESNDPNDPNGGNILQYSWEQISSFSGPSRNSSVGFSINNMGYIGFGTSYPDFYNDFFKYDPISKSWTKLSNFPGPVRRNGIAFVIGAYAYADISHI